MQCLEPESLPRIFFCSVFPFYDSWSNWSCLLIFPHSCSFPIGALSRIFCVLMHEAPYVSARVSLLMPATGVEKAEFVGVNEAENATHWLHFPCKKMCLCDGFQNPMGNLEPKADELQCVRMWQQECRGAELGGTASKWSSVCTGQPPAQRHPQHLCFCPCQHPPPLSGFHHSSPILTD